MPPAKRKVAPKAAAKKAAAAEANTKPEEVAPKRTQPNPINAVVHNAQSNEAFHPKYIKELQKYYAELGHDTFTAFYMKTLQQLMMRDETQRYATVGLKFMAKFATSYGGEDAHPILVHNFEWLLGTVSLQPHIRFRLCQFVNLLLNALSNEATLDDDLCDNILKYMFERLKDVSSTVRVQALTALQRLQMPENPNDPVVKIYQFHLNNDPSPIVRQAVITAIGRNIHTIPFILERFWDVDDKVRRHAYLHMCSYSVRSYKVAQRLTFLEQGLNDHSPMVRKVVVKVLLPSWLETYNKKFIDFVAALKLDANEQDIERFRKTAKMTLNELFTVHPFDDLIESLELYAEGDHAKCIPLDKLSVESSLYWLSLAEFCSKDDDRDGQLERILPELTTFCDYVTSYFVKTNEEQMDKWQQLEHHYILMTLVEMMSLFDLADEIGRQNLKSLITEMLSREKFDENIVSKVIECLELLEPNAEVRLQFIADIIHNLVDVGQSATVTIEMTNPQVIELLDRNPSLKVKVSTIKLRIMELQENEMNCIQKNDYMGAEKFKEQIVECNEKFTQLITPHLERASSNTSLLNTSSQSKRMFNEDVTRCIQMAYFVVRSKNVKSLIPAMSTLFKNFIRRQIEVNQMFIRGWALKCGISFSLLYDQLAKDVYAALYVQFFKHQNPDVWATSIGGMIELIDRYGFDFFEEDTPGSENGDAEKRGEKLKKSRQLYNSADQPDTDDDEAARQKKTNVMYVFDHFLDDCAEEYIQQALIDGYCRLLLHDHISGPTYMSKMLLKYFNPSTETNINQMLGIFFENLITHHKQESLQEALFLTLFTVLEAPADSQLQDIRPETIIKFVVNATLPDATRPGLNIHDKIATSFLDAMSDNVNNKELLKILSKEAMTLEVSDNPTFRNDLKDSLDNLLKDDQIEIRTATHLKHFKMKLDGIVGHARELHDQTEPMPNDVSSDKSPTHKSPATSNKSPRITSPKSPRIMSPKSPRITSPKSAATPSKITTPRSQTSIGSHRSPRTPDSLSSPGSPTLPKTPINVSLQVPATDDRTPKADTINTVFGLDNTSSVRHLRKSRHVRQASSGSETETRVSPSSSRVGRTSKTRMANGETPSKLARKNVNSPAAKPTRRNGETTEKLTQKNVAKSAQKTTKNNDENMTRLTRNNDKNAVAEDEVIPASPVSVAKPRRANLTLQSSRPRRAVNSPSKPATGSATAAAAPAKRKNELVSKSPPLPVGPDDAPVATVSKQNHKKSKASEAPESPARSTTTSAASSTIAEPTKTKPLSTRRTLEYTDTPLVTETSAARRKSRLALGPSPSQPASPRSTKRTTTPAAKTPSRRHSNATSGGSSSKENQHSTATSPIQPNSRETRTSASSVETPAATAVKSPKILSPKSVDNRRASPPRKPTIASLIAGPRKRLLSPKKVNLMPDVRLKRITAMGSSTDSGKSPPPKKPKILQLKLHRIRSVTEGAVPSTLQRTRNASVLEFMKNNIITRNRRSADQTTLLSISRAERSTGTIGGGASTSKSTTTKSTPTKSATKAGRPKATTSRIPTSTASASRIPRLRNK